MIVATKTGWLIACKLVRETRLHWHVIYADSKFDLVIKIKKDDPMRIVTDDFDKAQKFAAGE